MNFVSVLKSLVEIQPDAIKRHKVTFKNGYGASIIKGPGTYGYEKGLYEVAVLKNGDICYDTLLTDDVIGYLSRKEVRAVLEKIRGI